MRIVGRGTFGKVRIVEHRETRKLYALKYISKLECIHMDAVRNVIKERTILEQLDHPFLCRLRFAFQDSESLYMVSDLMLGGDLHYHISRTSFSEDVLRLWFAELASAIKYLHFNRVVHRDIKPHNILMDDKGHVHLADFNIATHLHSHRLLTSNSGTAYYMAPEMFKGGGYNEAVDWWALGVTLYECIYGKRPFDHETTEELRSAIRRGHIQYPTIPGRHVSGECLAAIQGFLEMNPAKRLGQGHAGWTALIRHPFFRSIDWQLLELKALVPGFQPPSDQNNFDLTYDIEDLLLDNRCTHSKQPGTMWNKDKPGQNEKIEREMNYMADNFKPFDFTIFEKYEGFKDPINMTVGEPPDWVKPAFEGADQGDLLPIKHVTIDDDVVCGDESTVWRGINRSASTSNLAAQSAGLEPDHEWRRRSLGTLRKQSESTSLSEEYAMSLQGIRKKQSTRSFRERRERDRKSIVPFNPNYNDPHNKPVS
ncbi:kinase-like domain-containing protein [Radiomyces spectabilis]|uniref:kinase-like domain-containing protein n=1 Tax=Radiomyces spectabilis TaxID=64574 RepID=UPI00222046A8|nr:kinase-like domain-containing protein [Radiomyces spectabilis]KAI8388502.1 kinase-like domain-containing protein [Radiomyces spectabilis]